MNIFVWMLAGAVLGWIGISFLSFNEQRGTVLSMIIGATGGFLGGKFIAPMFTAAAAVPGDFNSSALLFAVGVSAAFLAIGNLVYNRFGF